MIDKLMFWSLWPVIGLFARMALKWDVARHAPIPAGPKIIVANHPSTGDPFLLALAARRPTKLLITQSAFKVPVFGRYLRWSGHIPVIPGQGRMAFERAKHLLQQGRSIILFPEGDLSPRKGGLHRPHSGAARLALSTGAPIVPVGIYLRREALHYIIGRIDGRRIISRWPVRGPYAMTVGQALTFEGNVEDRSYVRSISEHIMHAISELVEQGKHRAKTPRPSTRWESPLSSHNFDPLLMMFYGGVFTPH